MPKVSREEVEHVARLARLSLSEEEKERFTNEFNSILEYFAKMQELDTRDVPPTSHVFPMQNVTRPDIPGPTLTQEEALANAPDQRDGYFVVPRIVET